VLAALRAQVAHLREQDPRVRQQLPGAVAQMRVTTRQLRSTLHGFARVLDPERTRPMAENLKWLGAQLADARDTETLVEQLRHDVRALPKDLIVGPIIAELRQAMGRLATEGAQTIATAVTSARYQALHDGLDQLLADPPFTRRADGLALEELPHSLATAVRKLERRLAQAQALAPGPERDEALHEARKADKRLRYMTEVLIPLVGAPAHGLHRQSVQLQQLLGDYQDSVVARQMLRLLATEAHAQGHNAFTYGLLYACEHLRAEQVLRQLPERLARLREVQTLSWLPQPPDARGAWSLPQQLPETSATG